MQDFSRRRLPKPNSSWRRPLTAAPPPRRAARSFAYFTWLEAGDSTFMAVVRRPCLFERVEGRRVEFVIGNPIVLEHAARRGTAGLHLPRLRERFRLLSRSLGKGVVMMNKGDLMSAFEETGSVVASD